MNNNIKSIILILFMITLSRSSLAQTLDRRDMLKRDYKYFICDIMEGNVDSAISICKSELKKNPNNAEVYFNLTLSYSQKSDMDSAFFYFNKAINNGIPFERFLSGPRKLLEPFTTTKKFKQYYEQSQVEVLHGPMLGDVTDTSARFWIRTLNESHFKIVLSKTENFEKTIVTNISLTSKENDFTGIVEANGLESNKTYFYKLIINGKEYVGSQNLNFKTYPKAGGNKKFSIAFGGGSNYNPTYEYIWETILEHNPLAFLWLGDNTYFNIADVSEHQRYCFYRRYSRPEFRKLTQSIPTYAIYDDHDFGGNDCVGGPLIDKPLWKKDVTLKIFKENFNNPYYGNGEETPGCWHNLSIGKVEVFMLDGRYYRTDPRGEDSLYIDSDAKHASMLGSVQKEWLFDKLKKSKATFKIIASPVPWASSSKKSTQWSANLGKMFGALDTWQGFPEEREEIFSFIEQNKIEGVFLISADRHRSDAWKIERENGYALYEAMSSHLTKDSSHPFQPEAIFSILGKPAFGKLTFDFTKDDPEIIYQVVKIDGKIVAELIVKESELKTK